MWKKYINREKVLTLTKQFSTILDTKYNNTYLSKVMKNQCQHSTETQRNELLTLLQKIKELFDGTLGT